MSSPKPLAWGYTHIPLGKGGDDVAEGEQRLVDGLSLVQGQPHGIGLVHLPREEGEGRGGERERSR